MRNSEEESKVYSILDYLEPKYSGKKDELSPSSHRSKPRVIATPSLPPHNPNIFSRNASIDDRKESRDLFFQPRDNRQSSQLVGKESTPKPAIKFSEGTKKDDFDFLLFLEREEHNRKLHEEDQSKWSFLMKRRNNAEDIGNTRNTNTYNYASRGHDNHSKSSNSSYYNDKRSRYTDEDKWTAQLEQLRAEKETAKRHHEYYNSGVYDLTHDDDIGSRREDRSGGGYVDSAYYSSGVTDLYSVGRAQASFLDANYSESALKKPEKKSHDGSASSNKKIFDIQEFARQTVVASADTNKDSTKSKADPVANAFLQNFNIMYQTQLLNTDLSSGKDLDALINSSIDSICVEMLKLNLAEVLAFEEQGEGGSRHSSSHSPPLSFLDVNSYISFFQPLLIEEFKAALISYILDIHSDDKQERSVFDVPTSSLKTDDTREFSSVEVRPEVVSQRSNESKLHEVHLRVLRQEDRHVDFIKDELVLMTSQRIPENTKTKRQLVKERHFLGIVLASTSRRAQTSKTFSVLVNKKHQHDIDKDRKTTWTCVSMFNLSSFLREWHALLSMKHMQSLPLAGYLLNGSPVISAAQLTSLSESLVSKLRALEIGVKHKAPADRIAVLDEAVQAELQAVLEVKVNVALLKFTNIGKDIKHIVKNKEGMYSSGVVELAEKVMSCWTGLIKAQEKSSSMRTKKGGKIMEIPDDMALVDSSVIAKSLWTSLRSLYNRSQLFAIHYTLEQFKTLKETGIVLVQGPPGTGKTSTIIGILSALLQTPLRISIDQPTESTSSRRILVCAPSNTAIDEVVGRLATQGIIADQPSTAREDGAKNIPRKKIKIVRLGDSQQTDVAVRATVLDEQVEERVRKDALFVQHARLNESIREQEELLRDIGVRRQSSNVVVTSHVDVDQQAVAKKKTENEKCRDALQELYRQRTACERALEKLRHDTRHDILLSADIICTTLSSSNKQHFLDYVLKEQISFNTVIIDEAAQTTEISTLIPLRLGCRHLVLIGDPRQLPATVLSREAQGGGLGRSLFERLESLEHEVVMLTTQYRMHPEIRQFPSDYFYQGLLKDASIVTEEVDANRQLIQSNYRGRVTSSTLYKLNIKPVMLLHMEGAESKNGTSFVNEDEVRVVVDFLRGLIRHNVHQEESIAVIAPYKAQVKRIKRRIAQDNVLNGLAASLEVNSIDGFQGRERDIIIFSAVRSGVGNKGGIGFVADERRLNVAITRARKALIIFGNQQTLSADSVWRAMIRALHQRGLLYPDISAVRHLT